MGCFVKQSKTKENALLFKTFHHYPSIGRQRHFDVKFDVFMFQVSDPNCKKHNSHIWSNEYYTPNIRFTVHVREKINGRRLSWQQCPFCRGSWGNTPNKWWQECGKDSLVYLLFIFWICWCGSRPELISFRLAGSTATATGKATAVSLPQAS